MATVDRATDIHISHLVDKKFYRVEQINDGTIVFEDDYGIYTMYHESDCCEDVHIESIVGDLSMLVNTPILAAEKVMSKKDPKIDPELFDYTPESFTWTFYKFTTLKGYVDIRWWGESNGYYSEEVQIDFQSKVH